MRYLLLLFFSLAWATVGRAQVLTDPAEAFRQSQATGQPVLLVFSGSDWCAPCIQLDRQVLADSAFLRYAKTRVVLLEADFPQRKKLSPALVAAYEALAEAYNPEGSFPKLVVISHDRKRVIALLALRQTTATLIAQLERVLTSNPN